MSVTVHKCIPCEQKFANLKSLKGHNFKYHKDNECRKFICGDCDKDQLTEKRLKKHIGKEHTTLPCSKCKIVFQNASYLRKHRKTCLKTVSRRRGRKIVRDEVEEDEEDEGEEENEVALERELRYDFL